MWNVSRKSIRNTWTGKVIDGRQIRHSCCRGNKKEKAFLILLFLDLIRSLDNVDLGRRKNNAWGQNGEERESVVIASHH